MKFSHFQAIDGDWHTVYRRFEGGDMTSISCGGDEESHRREARRLQAEFDERAAASQREAERRLAGTARRLAPWYSEAR